MTVNGIKKYIIFAPPLTKNNGVRALYTLHDVLRSRGYEAFMYCPEEELSQYHYMNTISAQTRHSDIIVYPEVVRGNPLRFQNVVRYVLYYPGVFGDGTISYHQSENVFTWDLPYYSAPCLLLPCMDTTLFYNNGEEKTVDCYFVHKKGMWRKVPEIAGLIEINMTYPETRDELAALLRKTRTLYSFDEKSMLNIEAKCCGAVVKIVTEDGFRDCDDWDCYSSDIPRQQLDNFIKVTQEMDYQGDIEPYTVTFKQRAKIVIRCIIVCFLSIIPKKMLSAKLKNIKRNYINIIKRAGSLRRYNNEIQKIVCGNGIGSNLDESIHKNS